MIGSNDHANLLEKFDSLCTFIDWNVLQEFEVDLLNHLLHHCCSRSTLPSSVCISLMQRLVAIHPDVVKEEVQGKLPIHDAAASDCSVEVMEFLLGLYPESATIFTTETRRANLLHLVVRSNVKRAAKVSYLCSRYPEMIHQRNGEGKIPLHLALENSYLDVPTVQLLFKVGGLELVRTPIVHPTKSSYSFNGWLPLHSFMTSYSLRWSSSPSPLSDVAVFFRLMLRWYPEAAGTEAGNGTDKKTPYQLAVKNELDPYYLRLLLRAAPNLNPAELHRLNYAERRMAMFLAFKAAASDPEPLLMARLRFKDKELVKHVVSFL